MGNKRAEPTEVTAEQQMAWMVITWDATRQQWTAGWDRSIHTDYAKARAELDAASQAWIADLTTIYLPPPPETP